MKKLDYSTPLVFVFGLLVLSFLGPRSAAHTNEDRLLSDYRWKNRVLVVSAVSEDDSDLKVQQQELALAPEEFADRDMILVTLLENSVSTADGRELTSKEVAATREVLKIRRGTFSVTLIGKDGSVKLSSDTATSMTEIYSLIDTMPMRQRETSNR